MKMLTVNNVCSLLGGTLQSSLSITKAFPDAKHVVCGLSGSFDEETRQLFGENCRMECRPNLSRTIAEERPDIVLFQNTSQNDMPGVLPPGTLGVYYLHSGVRGSLEGRKRVGIRFSVSHWLAGQTNTPTMEVLHQPVHAPPGSRTEHEGLVVGRICTPKANKWKDEDLFPLYSRLAWSTEFTRFEFVGCPERLQPRLQEQCKDRATFFPAGYSARERYYEWDVLLYSGSLPESYGRTVVEAQRAGCVPVVRALGGFVEQVEDQETGFLCSCDDSFVDTIAYLTRNRDKLRQVSDNAVQSGDFRGSLLRWRNEFLTKVGQCLKKN